MKSKKSRKGAAPTGRLYVLLGAGLALALLLYLMLPGAGGDEIAHATAPTEAELQAENVSIIEEIFASDESSSEEGGTLFGLELSDWDAEEVYDAPHADNPINPRTQKPYSNYAMRRFEALRELFPENKMIPRRRSAEELEALHKEEEELGRKYYVDMRKKIVLGGLSKEQIDEYFSYRFRYTKDKLELFSYAVDHMPEGATDARLVRMRRLLAHNEAKVERMLSQKQEAYYKAGIQAEAFLN